jgi:hypothetical protein
MSADIGTINHFAKRCFNRWDMVKIKSGKGESVRIVCDDPRMLITLEYTSKDTVLDVTWYYQAQVYRSLRGYAASCAPHLPTVYVVKYALKWNLGKAAPGIEGLNGRHLVLVDGRWGSHPAPLAIAQSCIVWRC